MPSRTVQLVGTGEGLQNRVFPLRPGSTTVGRGAARDLCLDDPSVSRLHATIELGREGAVVTDEDSRNGTFVDDVRVEVPTPLQDGQTVRFGKVPFAVVEPRATLSTSQPALSRIVASIDSRSPTDTMLDQAVASFRTSSDTVDLLRSMAAVFATSRSASELREVIVDLVPRLVAGQRALLLEFDGTGGIAVQASDGASTAFSQNVVDWVVERREATLFVDAASDERLASALSIAEGAVQCVLAAPLVADDEVLGVLYVDNTADARALGEIDVDVLVLLASQAALALKNASLQRLRHTYERYFPPRTSEQLLQGGVLASGPVSLEVTALFADLSNYTGLCERLAPEELVELLDRFFPPMARIVFERGGMLEKYIGDAMLAAWGVPDPAPDDACRAIDAAREIRAEAARLDLDVHIGLHTGRVAFTHLGTEDYLQLALIGDATTLASRVCGQAGAGEIVLTEATRSAARLAGDAVPLGPRALRGRTRPLELFRLR